MSEKIDETPEIPCYQITLGYPEAMALQIMATIGIHMLNGRVHQALELLPEMQFVAQKYPGSYDRAREALVALNEACAPAAAAADAKARKRQIEEILRREFGV